MWYGGTPICSPCLCWMSPLTHCRNRSLYFSPCLSSPALLVLYCLHSSIPRNCLPTLLIYNHSLFFMLFQHHSSYTKLCSFGFLCYPWLRPYTTNKLQPCSTPCIFVGYSPNKSVYLCLDPTTNHLYTSRHVKFVQTIYVFQSMYPHILRLTAATYSEWTTLIMPTTMPISPHCNPSTSL